ncbi:MAG: D-alanine--D-alanine ligase [Fimbriimonadaceae bacterium]|nr:D-alanine--D-alanine ligase [Fimbriimonadaceae bacterium]
MRTPAEIATAFAPRSALDGVRGLFLVGIGGAGMSALARLARSQGLTVAGTDSTASDETDRLMAEGIAVEIGHRATPVHDFVTAVGPSESVAMVLTDAVDLATSPEVAAARTLGLPLLRRSQLLGWLLRKRKVIAVTGTHGKTTTTGLVASALVSAGYDPLVVVGAQIPAWGSPVLYGVGEYAVVEACEAYDSFHDLDPHLVVLTNLELDHVDFHGTWENLRASVARFIARIPSDGALVYTPADPGSCEVADPFPGIKRPFQPSDLGNHPLALNGLHNRANAAAALQVVAHLGADLPSAMAGLARFTGAERRLQLRHEGPIGPCEHLVLLDDYAHHPTEIVASLQAVRERYPDLPLHVVFQPHLYSRTAGLIPEFADALSRADHVTMTDIYPAREAPVPGVSSARITELLTVPFHYVPSRHQLPTEVAKIVPKRAVVVAMGAGNISEFPAAFLAELGRPLAARAKVAVMLGGDSAEREVSLHSGIAVAEALTRRGYDVTRIDPAELLWREQSLVRLLGPQRPDVVFLAVHGTRAEDGTIQGLLELLDLPYTGSGVQASALAMDKEATKRVLAAAGIRTPHGQLLTGTDPDAVTFDGPYVVKPNAQGSTVGLSFVDDRAGLRDALARANRFGSGALVEEWVVGMEVSVPVLGGRALPVVEIAPASGRYDFASKYLPGATDEIVPARLPDAVTEAVQAIAVRSHDVLGCRGATRTDMIIRDPHGAAEIFVLEVNTLPGMTGTSLLPNSARAAGIDFDTLCELIVEEARR